MEDEALYHLLAEVMERLAVKVVRKNLHDEEFKIAGGLCKVRGEDYLFLDKRLPVKDQISMLIRELSRHNLEDRFLPPLIRDLMEQDRENPRGKFAS